VLDGEVKKRPAMFDDDRQPFDSIADAHQYIGILRDVVRKSQSEVDEEIGRAVAAGAERRIQALYIVSHKLTQLHLHLDAARRTLNDLRTLRRLLFDERPSGGETDLQQVASRFDPPSN
jgi:hypothetical protein